MNKNIVNKPIEIIIVLIVVGISLSSIPVLAYGLERKNLISPILVTSPTPTPIKQPPAQVTPTPIVTPIVTPTPIATPTIATSPTPVITELPTPTPSFLPTPSLTISPSPVTTVPPVVSQGPSIQPTLATVPTGYESHPNLGGTNQTPIVQKIDTPQESEITQSPIFTSYDQVNNTPIQLPLANINQHNDLFQYPFAGPDKVVSRNLFIVSGFAGAIGLIFTNFDFIRRKLIISR